MRLALSAALRTALPLAAALLTAPAALAQNPLQNGRPVIASPAVLGMGDASVAFPTRGSSFFYNPAHVALTAGLKPQITALGVQVRASTNLKDHYDFFQDEISPAIDRGLTNLSAAERDTLYDRAQRLTRKRAFLTTETTPLAATMRVGPLAVGVGVVGSASARYRTTPGGAGAPNLDASVVTDLSGVASVAADLTPFGMEGLALGANARLTKRTVTVKDKPLDAFSTSEDPYLHEATALGFDLGAVYNVPLMLPGSLTIGASLLDVAGSDFQFDYKGRTYCGQFPPYCDVDQTASPVNIAQEDSLAQTRFGANPSYRVGVAYTTPSLFGLLAETGVALDYVGYSDPQISGQPFLAHLSMGAQVQVARMLALRLGLNQGYVSAGAGAKLGPLALDYAFYGFEQGTKPGDDASWQHLVALKLVF